MAEVLAQAPAMSGACIAPAPIVRHFPARATGFPVKIVALNAGGGGDVEAMARCLKRPPLLGAGIVMLCEADSHMGRSKRRDVPGELADRLEMSLVFSPEYWAETRAGEPGRSSGNAILCRAPLCEVRLIPLPNPTGRRPKTLRGGTPTAIAVTVTIEHLPITAAVVHLDSRASPAQRDLQMAALLAAMPAAGSAIIGGDLNTTTTSLRSYRGLIAACLKMAVAPRRFHFPEPYEPLFARLAAGGFLIDGANARGIPSFSFSRWLPYRLRPRLDWIALRGLKPKSGSAAVVAARAGAFSPRFSDHDFIVCDAGP